MRIILSILLTGILFGCKGNSEDKPADLSEAAPVAQTPEIKESISRGATIYNNFCASCHLAGGEGIAGVFPPLKNSNWLTEKPDETIHAIKYGLRGPITVNGEKYDNLMPDPGLTDQEVADVLNYIHNSWGNRIEDPVTVEEVAAIEK